MKTLNYANNSVNLVETKRNNMNHILYKYREQIKLFEMLRASNSMSIDFLIHKHCKKERKNYDQRSREILLNWLRQHAETPYPTKKDKDLLAHATGLTKNQVTVWFLNARKRYLDKM